MDLSWQLFPDHLIFGVRHKISKKELEPSVRNNSETLKAGCEVDLKDTALKTQDTDVNIEEEKNVLWLNTEILDH